jgi:hypothetical protein
MKQGSTDDPFADDEPDESGDAETESPLERSATDTSEESLQPEPTARGRPQRQSLPYIHSRDGVKDGRTQRPVFLRDHVEEGIEDLVADMERELGEDIYKTDVTEAAMVVAQRNPELVRETLEEWGYGWE